MAINFANNSSLANITALPASVSGGGLTLVSSQTASASASLEFSMDSTYDSYVFKFINCHPSVDDTRLTFQCSTNGGSTYATTLTSTSFRTTHTEIDDAAVLGYITASDQAQGTSFERISESIGILNDDSVAGYLQIFNPSSTTYVKHFIARTIVSRGTSGNGASENYQAGYFNTTSAINAIQFKMASGNIDDGIIKMYGVA